MYSVREVAEIVGVAESRIRYWAQTGFVGPSTKREGKPAFTFRDLVAVKTAKALLEQGVSLQHARRSLEALRAQLPEVAQPLSQLRIVSDGDKLTVLSDGARFEPLSGQLVLDLDMSALGQQAAEAPPPRVVQPSAWALFSEAQRLEQETGRTAEAIAAYEQALALDPKLAAAHTNLGVLLSLAGRNEEARQRFESALAIDPVQPEARFNLGNVYDTLGDVTRAISEWSQAVSLAPDFADAHFNLGAALVESGATRAGAVHLERYLTLQPLGDCAEESQRLLDACRRVEEGARAALRGEVVS
jgi:tetratricopeptide (TPR) repeat protein